MRASIRPYSSLRCSTCQRGKPSSILPYGRVFCSSTATRIPESARISAATDPEIAPPITATKCCPGFVIYLPPRSSERDSTTQIPQSLPSHRGFLWLFASPYSATPRRTTGLPLQTGTYDRIAAAGSGTMDDLGRFIVLAVPLAFLLFLILWTT